jgi:tetratricopeptide (TPR) repeat protein
MTTTLPEGRVAILDGHFALANLNEEIAALEVATRHVASMLPLVQLADALRLRGHFLSRIADHHRCGTIADLLVFKFAEEGVALATRARAEATMRRFDNALADLDHAERLGYHDTAVDRACVLTAVGRGEDALVVLNHHDPAGKDFRAVASRAALSAERGDLSMAEANFDRALTLYAEESPFPLAALAVRRGLMWVAEDRRVARHWLGVALDLVPTCAPALGYVAEIDLAAGRYDLAIVHLRRLVADSDNPEYAGLLATALAHAGQDDEAAAWRSLALACFDELMLDSPEAFADDAAEFWLGTGDDPARALRFARRNFNERPTRRAEVLLRSAEIAVMTSLSATKRRKHFGAIPIDPRGPLNIRRHD